jgi:hypothetical protein
MHDLPYHRLKDGYTVFSPTLKYLTSLLLMNYQYDEFYLCNIRMEIWKSYEHKLTFTRNTKIINVDESHANEAVKIFNFLT